MNYYLLAALLVAVGATAVYELDRRVMGKTLRAVADGPAPNEPQGVVWIGVMLHPDARGNGYARQLVGAAIVLARAKARQWKPMSRSVWPLRSTTRRCAMS